MSKVYYDKLPSLSIRYANDYREMQTYTLSTIRAFMYFILEKCELTIGEYLEEMGQDPYFLLAATGLGKTVAAPIHSYLRHCEQVLFGVNFGSNVLFNNTVPRLWVVEPKVAIAESQAVFMNTLFEEFIKQRNNSKDVGHPALFGSKTSVSNINYHSPIKFITTGIFAIYARLGWIEPNRDCVIIDEAHVTIESSEGVELAIAICREKGITVHYMSATVDTSNLQSTLGVKNIIEADKQRFPIWMHNTGLPMEHCIVDIIGDTLAYPNLRSPYFPQGQDNVSRSIRDAVLEKGRSKGFLVVINSFAGVDSDANTIAELLSNAPYARDIEVLLLAGAVIRNPRKKLEFEESLKRIERSKKKYVIIATSVVEMGVTFPTLDFVATMDSGFEQITIGDTVLPEIFPLPVNSLKQRIGRVGRKRPGIGYITDEVGAYYSSLNDQELNGKLKYETIGLPLKKGSLILVAQYSFAQEWSEPIKEITDLNLPSGIHNDVFRLQEFLIQRERLIGLGIADGNRLTEEGRYCERWLEAGVDIAYAVRLQEALSAKDEKSMYFYLMTTALSNVNFQALQDQIESARLNIFVSDYVDGYLRPRKGLIRKWEEIEFVPQSEILALYNILSYLSNSYSDVLFRSGNASVVRKQYYNSFASDCRAFGFSPSNVEIVLRGLSSILKTFSDTNRKRNDFIQIFGERKEVTLDQIMFPKLSANEIVHFINDISTLPNRVKVILAESQDGFTWKETNGSREGYIRSGSTSIDMANGLVLTTKLIPLPGNEERKAGEAWKLVHPQYHLSK